MFTPHSKEPQMPDKPTARQLSYLKALASARGQSFTYPQTTAEASREIARLKGVRPESRVDQRRERREIADAIQAGPADAARVRADEVDGYGSTAVWTQNREQAPAPVQDPGPARARKTPAVGQRTELGAYEVNRTSRVIVGQRIDGVVRVSDVPRAGTGRSYLIERELDTKAELDALVADYLAEAHRLDAVPMSIAPSVEIPS